MKAQKRLLEARAEVLAASEAQLRTLARATPFDELDRARRALACATLVQRKLVTSPKEARALLDEALRGFRKLAHRAWLRDAYVSLGNVHAAQSQHHDAVRCFRAALAGERDPERRALAQLNLAKVYLSEGSFYDALQCVARTAPEKLARKDVAHALLLLKARVYLTLGYDDAAVGFIRALKDQGLALRPVTVEHRYLGLMARLRFDRLDAFATRVEDFVIWAQKHLPERFHAFYELEGMLYRRLLDQPRVVNRRRFLDRARYLGKKCGAKRLLGLLVALDQLLAPRGDAHLDDVLDRLREMARSPDQLAFQYVALLLARELVRRARHAPALALLNLLDQHWEHLESGFPPATRRRLAASPSGVRAYRETLGARIPRAVARAFEAADQWLLSS